MPHGAIDRTAGLSPQDKLGAAFERAMPLVPPDVRATLMQMVQPASLAVMAVTLVAWAASHAFGVGEFIDAILLGIGMFTIGMSAWDAAREIHDFVVDALQARTSHDIDIAAQHLAKAIALIGITLVQAVLMHGQAKAAFARGRPQFRPVRGPIPDMPPPGNKLLLQRPRSLPGGKLGETDMYGRVKVARYRQAQGRDPKTGHLMMTERQEKIPIAEQRAILYHELFHRYFMPRVGPLRHLRANLTMTMYHRSAILRYLAEALAQGYGQMRMHGCLPAKASFTFLLDGGYVTVSQMWHEGAMIGNISMRGDLFHVTMSMGIPRSHEHVHAEAVAP